MFAVYFRIMKCLYKVFGIVSAYVKKWIQSSNNYKMSVFVVTRIQDHNKKHTAVWKPVCLLNRIDCILSVSS